VGAAAAAGAEAWQHHSQVGAKLLCLETLCQSQHAAGTSEWQLLPLGVALLLLTDALAGLWVLDMRSATSSYMVCQPTACTQRRAWL
jgi:hypothetical protein